MSERIDTDTLHVDDMHVVQPRAAGLDVHKMCITAAVRLCEAGRGLARTAVREFSALPDGLRAMTDWLRSHGVTAAAMEGTGVYWKAPFEALEDAGIHAELFHAQHVKQIRGKKTDVNDSLWLARICQFGLALPSYVPPSSVPPVAPVDPLPPDSRRRAQPEPQPGPQDPRPRRPAPRRHLVRHLRRQRAAHTRRAGCRAPAGPHPRRADHSRASQAGAVGPGRRPRPARTAQAADASWSMSARGSGLSRRLSTFLRRASRRGYASPVQTTTHKVSRWRSSGTTRSTAGFWRKRAGPDSPPGGSTRPATSQPSSIPCASRGRGAGRGGPRARGRPAALAPGAGGESRPAI